MSECRDSVEIVNKRGLHARASAKFVGHVAELPSSVKVTVSKDGMSAEGGSILGLMMLGAAKGDTVEIACSGEGAQDALAALGDLVRGGFGEE
ncbi:HPr family phosphocarrier protein [Novosphingobium sp. Leaf2]|uniref:HPr family phosphocarrier protein n=1 Tax=Novosphingobium sp. Leaf2 TaxID=1735670 RepID=UPI0006F5A3DD|nr:HPr family phosphocarrier protein [Novosphingobium sp. Leaf2]KQM17365.1 serine kinase [Novosphingobium sp. Leaf2]